jgi:hypothetical protein
MTGSPIPQHDDEDPRERELSRRSGTPTLGIWNVLGLIALLGILVYVVSAIL